MAEAAEVRQNESERRFEIIIEGHVAKLDYSARDGRLKLLHTEVPATLEGRGLGGKLVKAALEHARAEGMKVVPACSFAEIYIRRHPEYQELVAE